MLYEWKIALRFLKDGKAQTLFILLGIAVGVAVQIFLSSLISGLQENLIDTTIGNRAHITITAKANSNINSPDFEYINTPKKEDKLGNYQGIIEGLQKNKEISAVSPSVVGTALYNQGESSTSLVVKGIDLELADEIYDLKSRIAQGESDIDSNRVLIGTSFANEFNLTPGDLINLSLPGGSTQSFIVGGIFDLESEALNGSWIFMELSRAQRIYGLNGYISNIEIQMNEPFDADILAPRLTALYPEIDASDWKAENAQLLTGLNSQSSSSLTIQAFVLVAIALGISSVLAVSVVQKSKQIGILKAMGATSNSASSIFLIQGGVLGFIGGIFGILIGYLLIQGFIIGTTTASGPIFNIVVKRDNLVLVVFISTMAGLISSFVPARKSSSLNPMEVIRNG